VDEDMILRSPVWQLVTDRSTTGRSSRGRLKFLVGRHGDGQRSTKKTQSRETKKTQQNRILLPFQRRNENSAKTTRSDGALKVFLLPSVLFKQMQCLDQTSKA
jgi:hypothetical protein